MLVAEAQCARALAAGTWCGAQVPRRVGAGRQPRLRERGRVPDGQPLPQRRHVPGPRAGAPLRLPLRARIHRPRLRTRTSRLRVHHALQGFHYSYHCLFVCAFG